MQVERKLNTGHSAPGRSWDQGQDDGGWSAGPPAKGSGWNDNDSSVVSTSNLVPGEYDNKKQHSSPRVFSGNESNLEFRTWSNPSGKPKDSIVVDSSDKEAWPSINNDNSETASDAGDDNLSVKSGSVISSSSNPSVSHENNQSLSAIQGQSASDIWSTNSNLSRPDSTWKMGSAPNSTAANINSLSWGNSPTSLSVNNQGHNMQTDAGASGGDNLSNSNYPSKMGWGSTASDRPQNLVQTGAGNTIGFSGAQINGPSPAASQAGQNSNQISWQNNAFQLPRSAESAWNINSMAVSANNSNNNVSVVGGAGKGGGNNSVSAQNQSPGWGSVGTNTSSTSLSSSWRNTAPPSGDWGVSESVQQQWGSANTKSQWGDEPTKPNNSVVPKSQPSTWAQAAGKGLNTSISGNKDNAKDAAAASAAAAAAASASTGNRSQVNNNDEKISLAIESHIGWGEKPVRQDTSWDLDGSVKAKHKQAEETPSNVWNNHDGTAIWEASVQQQVRNTSVGSVWNSAGASGSQYDEKDNGRWGMHKDNENGNNWRGETNENSIGTWGGGNGGDNGSSSADMWGGKTETGSWGEAAARGSHPNYGDPNSQWNTTRRDGTHHWGETQKQPPPPPPPHGWNPSEPPNNSLIAPGTKPNEPEWNKQPRGSGWGEPGPPSRVNDDGTSIWAANSQQQARAAGWGDTANWNPTITRPKQSTSSSSSWQDTNDASWNAQARKDECWAELRSWNDADMGNWNDMQEYNCSWTSGPGMNRKRMVGSIKVPTNFKSGMNQLPQRSKLLQQLIDMGFKKDEAQNALISNNLNYESALADLVGAKKDIESEGFSGRKLTGPGIGPESSASLTSDDISDTLTDKSLVPNISMQNTPFPNAQIPNPAIANMKQGPSLPHSSLTPNNSSINAMQQKNLQPKILQTQPVNSFPAQGPIGRGQLPNQSAVQQQVAQAAQQQQILQQLKMAVNAGLINPQLLQHHLPPTMLMLLQQLLHYQQMLQQLVCKQQQIQQNRQNQTPAAQRQHLEQVTGMINNVRQQILQQQQKITQASQMLLKSQQSTPEPPQSSSESTIPEIGNLPIASSQPQGQSRLTKWKQPALGGNGDPEQQVSDPSKAVGSKPIHQSQSTPNLGSMMSLNLSGDPTWSNAPAVSTANWPTKGNKNSPVPEGRESTPDNKESVSSSESSTPTTTTSANVDSSSGVNDTIIEFVPGQLWQGISKNPEDDPHITPGSISRQLSVNTVKDEYLNNLTNLSKSSPSITADTSQWNSNPNMASLASNSKTWTSDSVVPTSFTSEVWKVPMPKNSVHPNRPPPTNSGRAGNWNSGQPVGRQQSWAGRTDSSAFPQANCDPRMSSASVWLVLRNLTPQIDGSTLRTLCQQHGPLVYFCLFLNQGQSLVRYSTREESIKAQKALNTCVLGNTTILAEFVPEAEAQRFIEQQQNASQWTQSQSNMRNTVHSHNNRSDISNWGNSSHASVGGYTSASGMWSNSLWGNVPVDEHNTNPLLGNILGGDAM